MRYIVTLFDGEEIVRVQVEAETPEQAAKLSIQPIGVTGFNTPVLEVEILKGDDGRHGK